MESKKIIEVNGKQYDAVSGAVLSVGTAPPLRAQGRNIDGFFRPRTISTPTAQLSPVRGSIASLTKAVSSAPELKKEVASTLNRAVNHARPHSPQPAKARVISVSHPKAVAQSFSVRRGPANHQHRAVQHSRTLRRDAVPQPVFSTHALLRPKGTLQHSVPHLITIKKSAEAIDPERLTRAQKSQKSPLIAHHTSHVRAVAPSYAPVSVQPLPSSPPVAPTPMPGNSDEPSAPAPKPSNKPTDMFTEALAKADNYVDIRAHRALYRKKARTHIASMAAGSLVLIVIAAFVAYANNPELQFKVASIRAGVSANMPNFAAAGFAYNGVRAGEGKLTLGFKGKTGTYQLTQANTNMSDSDMIQNISATDASGEPVYSVVQSGNLAVYRFSNTSATWVSGGKWYSVSGNSALTNEQVKSIVQNI